MVTKTIDKSDAAILACVLMTQSMLDSNRALFRDADIVVSIKLQTINDQLRELQAQKPPILPPRLMMTRKAIPEEKRVEGGPEHEYKAFLNRQKVAEGEELLDTEVTFRVVSDSSRDSLVLILELRSGELIYDEGGERKKQWFHDSYAFKVKLAWVEQKQEAEDVEMAVPERVAAKLAEFTNDMFTVRSLLLDIGQGMTPADNRWTNQSGERWDPVVRAYLNAYFTTIKLRNPFAMAHSVSTNSNTRATRFADKAPVPDELKPVGAVFSVYDAKDGQDWSSLDVVIGTKGGHGAPPAETPWVPESWLLEGRHPNDLSSREAQARVIFSHSCLIEKLLVRRVFDDLESALRTEVAKVFPGVPQRSYEEARRIGEEESVYPGKGRIGLEVAKWFEGNAVYVQVMRVSYVNDANRSCTVAITGQVKMANAIDKHIGAPGWLLKDTHVKIGETTWSSELEWDVKTTITASKETKSAAAALSVKTEVNPGKVVVHEEGSNVLVDKLNEIQNKLAGPLKALGMFGLFLDGIFGTSILAQDRLQAKPRVDDVISGLGLSINGMIILPAGQVFFYRNPWLDQDGNLYCDLSYKSEM